MCGHVGVAGTIFLKEEKVLKTLLILDSIRGDDSTGIAAVGVTGNVIVAKELGNPYNLFEVNKFEKALKPVNRAIIGHNRWATVGGVSKLTAHPFEFETLVGAHNGTLKNKYKLADHMDFKVDSENLFWHIEQHGLDDALKIIDGAWALVWWDKTEETMNFLRNKERPLYIVATEDGKTMFWASEKWMLSVSCNRYDVKIGEIHEIQQDMLYSFHIGKDKVIEKPKVRKAEGTYVAPVYQGQNNQNGLWLNTPQQQQPAFGASTNNVTPITKAGQGTPEKKLLKLSKPRELEAGLVKSYIDSKRVLFEIAGSCVDTNGSRYLKLMDIMVPAAPVRLYLKKNDPMQNMIGREIIADIGTFISDKKGEGSFFKASPWNVVIVPEKEEKAVVPKAANENDLLYMGAGRKLYTKKEWMQRYSTCTYCFSTLDPEDRGNRLTQEGTCLCGDCTANLPEEFMGMKLMSVI